MGPSPLFRDVSLTLGPGAMLGLSGPNGSGKSTTVSILTGLLQPSAGRVCFNGIDAGEQPNQYRAHIGYVPEEAHLYPYLTGPEYLAFDRPVARIAGGQAAAQDRGIPGCVRVDRRSSR
jgi:ABC-type multidrug transport system ATPase subunit